MSDRIRKWPSAYTPILGCSEPTCISRHQTRSFILLLPPPPLPPPHTLLQVFFRVVGGVRFPSHFRLHYDDAAIVHQLQDEVSGALAVADDDV